MSKITIQPPVTLTLLATFKCTAACNNLKNRLYNISIKLSGAILKQGYNVVEENFPEVYKKVNKNTLRNIILMSFQKGSTL